MIYFDEAGYTGSDLTNSEQPYFALASIRMTDDEIIRMKNDIGYYEWGKELHFIKMYKNFQGRAMLDKIFNHPYICFRPLRPFLTTLEEPQKKHFF